MRVSLILYFAFGLFIGPMVFSKVSATEANASLVEQSLSHPTSLLLRNTLDGEDYLKKQKELLQNISFKENLRESSITLFQESLNPKEISSLLHQKDLFNAYEKNPKLQKLLKGHQFDHHAYLRGCFESDLGKLASYKKLFTEKSAKSDLLLQFLKGQGPAKSLKAIKNLFKNHQIEFKAFLNPNVGHEQLRSLFKEHPILLGYLHEFPGMIDAVMAHELGIIATREFQDQVAVNLFHSGPAKGYWGLLESTILPTHFKKSGKEEVLDTLFAHSIFEGENSGHPHYGSPLSFEAFISTFFDRMSQGTRGGYIKIDWEIGGNPLKNAESLLLGQNIPWTQEQIEELKLNALKSQVLTPQEKTVIEHLCQQGVSYLSKYQSFIKKHLTLIKVYDHYSLKVIDKDGKVHNFSFQEGSYTVNDKVQSEGKTREYLHQIVIPLLQKAEIELGDPFEDFSWEK